jgi:phosphate transport system permease protein
MTAANPTVDQVTVFGTRETATLTTRRRLTNWGATLGMFLCVLAALVPLVLIVAWVVKHGIGIMSWSFLSKDIPIQSRTAGPGMGPAVVGTLLITLTATILAVPLGVLAAVYLNEYGKTNKMAELVRFLTNVMTGVPSIVMGLFIYTLWVLRFKQSGFAGALALACLMLPIVIRSAEEILALVPDELREASAALGARSWRTTVSVVLPAATPGIISGALLAVARAAGETAPLLFTLGVTSTINKNVFSGTTTALSAEIFRNIQTPFQGAHERAYGAALTLVVIVFVLSIAARIVSSRLENR